jgi:glycosyltransferase involved in cell wall biosynthesis
MKIVMIGQKGVPNIFGGVETHVTELSTRLVRMGHTVTAYARTWYTPRGTKLFNGIRVVRLPSIKTKTLDAFSHTFFSSLHACFFVRPDVYHYHGVGQALLSFIPRILAPRARVVVTFHAIDRFHEKWNYFARLILHIGEYAAVTFPHETIVVSKVLRAYVKDTYGVTATYIPNGITPRRAAADPILLKPFGLEPFGYVSMVSRLVRHKGAHTLIKAWKKARKDKPEAFANLKLALVGDSAFTDSYVRELKDMAKGDDSIVFTGYQRGETLEALFMGSRFIVHPSVSEGLPIAVLEAMSYGKAVIASSIPENMEAIGDHGIPFKPNDVNDLAKKMVELVADPMKAASMGHVARHYVEDNFNWNGIAEKTVRIYEAALPHGKTVLALE